MYLCNTYLGWVSLYVCFLVSLFPSLVSCDKPDVVWSRQLRLYEEWKSLVLSTVVVLYIVCSPAYQILPWLSEACVNINPCMSRVTMCIFHSHSHSFSLLKQTPGPSGIRRQALQIQRWNDSRPKTAACSRSSPPTKCQSYAHTQSFQFFSPLTRESMFSSRTRKNRVLLCPNRKRCAYLAWGPWMGVFLLEKRSENVAVLVL